MKYIILLAFFAYGCNNTDNAAQKNEETNKEVLRLNVESRNKVDSLTTLGKTDEAVLVIKDYKRRVDSVIQNSLKRE